MERAKNDVLSYPVPNGHPKWTGSSHKSKVLSDRQSPQRNGRVLVEKSLNAKRKNHISIEQKTPHREAQRVSVYTDLTTQENKREKSAGDMSSIKKSPHESFTNGYPKQGRKGAQNGRGVITRVDKDGQTNHSALNE